MKRALLSLTLLFGAAAAFGFDQSHALLTEVMKRVNKNGLIDYKALKEDPERLNAYLDSLNAVSEAEFKTWSEKRKIAFYVNAYNAFTLKAIIENYPIKASFFKSALYPKNSIRQIDGVWDKLRWPLLGKKMTLNDIEHETLREKFKEPRIHMALVCAARSCPPLRGEAYTGKKLDDQLDDQARQFLSSSKGLQIDREKAAVRLSKIFDWFKNDFDDPGVIAFVKKYAQTKDKDFLETADYAVSYLRYDWSLNEQ